MYVFRLVFTTKPNTAPDVFEICQRILTKHPYPRTTRAYRTVVGDGKHVIVEFGCKSLADWEKIHPEWMAGWSEDVVTEWRSFETLGRSEFLEVVEQRTDA